MAMLQVPLPAVIASPAVLWSNILLSVGVPLKFAISLAADIVIILYKILISLNCTFLYIFITKRS
jgi:hypothetical protein